MLSSAPSGALLSFWRRFRWYCFFFTEQHAMWDVHNERLLCGIIGQRDHRAAALQKPKDLPIPVKMDSEYDSKNVTRFGQPLHAPPILGCEPFPVGNSGQDFDGEVNVTDPVNIRAQHAAEQHHAVHPAEETSVPVYLLNARQKLVKRFSQQSFA